MPRKTSLASRIAWGAALAAAAAALLAAIATSMLAAFLLQRAEDRRLQEAALVLADELTEQQTAPTSLDEIVREERQETNHTGILFAVFDQAGHHVAGETQLTLPASGRCETTSHDTLRVCRHTAADGSIAVAAAAHAMPTSLFALAACIAALLAGVVAWLVSRPISRLTIAPLSRLRARLGLLNIDEGKTLEFGPVENVLEVDQLRTTIEQLFQRVHRAIDQAQHFAANAAHELRTPLTTIRAELELLAEAGTLSVEATANIVRVESKVAEMAGLVDRLLVLATPKSESPDATEIISLHDVVDDVIATLPSDDRQRILLADADATVRGDTVLLTTMFSNALANALKFGREIHVTISQAAGNAIIHIDDDGPGVEPADRTRIFEPFFRTTEALRRRIPGHGLGLALIRHIAETHNGHAIFVDKPTRGARLAIDLPLAIGA